MSERENDEKKKLRERKQAGWEGVNGGHGWEGWVEKSMFLKC